MYYDIHDYPILQDFELRKLPILSSVVDDTHDILTDEAVAAHDWHRHDGEIFIRAFHGTTHEFENFSTEHAYSGGYFGKALYFTSSHYDAHAHYGHRESLDLKSRIEYEAERLATQIEEQPQRFGLPKNSHWEECYDLAFEKTKAHLTGNSGREIEVLLRIRKPVLIDGEDSQKFYVFPEIWDKISEIETKILKEGDYDEDSDEFQDAVISAYDEIRDEHWEKLHDALREAIVQLSNSDEDIESVYLKNLDDTMIEDLTWSGVKSAIDQDYDLSDILDDDDNHIKDSIFSTMAFRLGYDSIIMINANKTFKNMEMDEHTSHIHLFSGKPENIIQLNRDIRPHSEANVA